MHVRSLIRIKDELQIVGVELTLVPGLPQILFLGLPDQALRESAIRIRSAIRAQGFQFPKAQQILVQLNPSHLKKSSRGLDLAVAAALLWETQQLPPPQEKMPLLYGELTLKGEVTRPNDLSQYRPTEPIWSGVGEDLPVFTYEVRSLNGLRHPVMREGRVSPPALIQRPSAPVPTFEASIARWLEVIAAGEHSVLVAGPPGVGKSTFVESIPSFLQPPPIEMLSELRKYNPSLNWRPVASPHHSASSLAMVGGGAALWAGEIAKVNQGVLIMDELLQFGIPVQEALREPMDSGSISIARAGRSRTFESQVLLLATTNLCRCGKFIPGPQDDSKCRCRAFDRRRILARLTGPFADRFAILLYMRPKPLRADDVSVFDLQARVDRAINFRNERSQHSPNGLTDAEDIAASLTSFQRSEILDDVPWSSHRRRESVLRVARTMADLDLARKISNKHLSEALELCVHNHRFLEESND